MTAANTSGVVFTVPIGQADSTVLAAPDSVLQKAGVKAKPVKVDLGTWGGLPIIAVGPKGGKIVAYKNGKPVYAGSAAASKMATLQKQSVGTKLKALAKWLLEDLGMPGAISGTDVVLEYADAVKLGKWFGLPALPAEGKPGKAYVDAAALAEHVGKSPPLTDDQHLSFAAEAASGDLDNADFPDLDDLVQVTGPEAAKFKGSHGNLLFRDSKTKKLWVFKGADPTIARAEEAASRVARLVLGDLVPLARVVHHPDKGDGVLLQVVEGEPLNEENHSNPKVTDLKAHAEAVAMHHVADWLVSNHDGHAGNFLAHGEDLLGIDKGQAWKFFGKDKLSPTYSPNPSDPIYVKFWTGVGATAKHRAAVVAGVEKALARAGKMTPEQFKSIVAPYVSAAAGHFDWSPQFAKKRLEAMASRLATLQADWEKFLSEVYGEVVELHPENFETMPDSETGPSTAKKLTVPVAAKKPEKTPVASVADKAPGWPHTIGKVTVHYPGNPPDGKWPKGYPGPGFKAVVDYKGADFGVEFLAGGKKGIEVVVTYPDGSTASFDSPNKASDSLYLWANGLPVDMSSTEKKEKGISYPAKTAFGVKVFGDLLFQKEDLPDTAKTVEEFDEGKDSPPDELSVSESVKALPPGAVEDTASLPFHVQEWVNAYSTADVPVPHPENGWPPIAPGVVVKLASEGWLVGVEPTVNGWQYVRWTASNDYATKGTPAIPDMGVGVLLETLPLDHVAFVPPAPDVKSAGPAPTADLPKTATVSDMAPSEWPHPVKPGTVIATKKKFKGESKKQEVYLQANEDGTFMVTLHTGDQETFDSLSAASDWVWVVGKGYKDADDYKTKNEVNKVPSGGGWKFWGVDPKDPPPPPEPEPSEPSLTPGQEAESYAPMLSAVPEGSSFSGTDDKGDDYVAFKTGPSKWKVAYDDEDHISFPYDVLDLGLLLQYSTKAGPLTAGESETKETLALTFDSLQNKWELEGAPVGTAFKLTKPTGKIHLVTKVNEGNWQTDEGEYWSHEYAGEVVAVALHDGGSYTESEDNFETMPESPTPEFSTKDFEAMVPGKDVDYYTALLDPAPAYVYVTGTDLKGDLFVAVKQPNGDWKIRRPLMTGDAKEMTVASKSFAIILSAVKAISKTGLPNKGMVPSGIVLNAQPEGSKLSIAHASGKVMVYTKTGPSTWVSPSDFGSASPGSLIEYIDFNVKTGFITGWSLDSEPPAPLPVTMPWTLPDNNIQAQVKLGQMPVGAILKFDTAESAGWTATKKNDSQWHLEGPAGEDFLKGNFGLADFLFHEEEKNLTVSIPQSSVPSTAPEDGVLYNPSVEANTAESLKGVLDDYSPGVEITAVGPDGKVEVYTKLPDGTWEAPKSKGWKSSYIAKLVKDLVDEGWTTYISPPKKETPLTDDPEDWGEVVDALNALPPGAEVEYVDPSGKVTAKKLDAAQWTLTDGESSWTVVVGELANNIKAEAVEGKPPPVVVAQPALTPVPETPQATFKLTPADVSSEYLKSLPVGSKIEGTAEDGTSVSYEKVSVSKWTITYYEETGKVVSAQTGKTATTAVALQHHVKNIYPEVIGPVPPGKDPSASVPTEPKTGVPWPPSKDDLDFMPAGTQVKVALTTFVATGEGWQVLKDDGTLGASQSSDSIAQMIAATSGSTLSKKVPDWWTPSLSKDQYLKYLGTYPAGTVLESVNAKKGSETTYTKKDDGSWTVYYANSEGEDQWTDGADEMATYLLLDAMEGGVLSAPEELYVPPTATAVTTPTAQYGAGMALWEGVYPEYSVLYEAMKSLPKGTEVEVYSTGVKYRLTEEGWVHVGVFDDVVLSTAEFAEVLEGNTAPIVRLPAGEAAPQLPVGASDPGEALWQGMLPLDEATFHYAAFPVGTKATFQYDAGPRAYVKVAPGQWKALTENGFTTGTSRDDTSMAKEQGDKPAPKIRLAGDATPESVAAVVEKHRAAAVAQKKAMEAAEKKAAEVQTWAASHPAVTDAETLTALAYLQAHVEEKLGKGVKLWARVDGKGVVIGSDHVEFPDVMQALGWSKPKGTPIDGVFYRATLKQLLDRTPGIPGPDVEGPDGKKYPSGTTFTEKKVETTKEELLKGEQGFHKYKPHKTDESVVVVKVSGNGDSSKTTLAAMLEKWDVPHEGDIVVGGQNVLAFVKKSELTKVGKTETLVDATIPPQPPKFRHSTIPGLGNFGAWDSPAHAKDFPTLVGVPLPRFGKSVLMGAPGDFRGGQVTVRRVKGKDGKYYTEVTGTLGKKVSLTKKNGWEAGEVSIMSAAGAKTQVANAKTHDYEEATGASVEHGVSFAENGTKNATSGGSTVEVHRGQAIMRDLFRVRILEGVDAQAELAEAMTLMGVSTGESPELENIQKKWALVRAHLGPKYGWNRELKNDPEIYNEAWLDAQLAKIPDAAGKLASMRQVEVFQGHTTWVIDDDEERETVVKRGWKYSSRYDKNVESLYFQLSQGAGWAARKNKAVAGNLTGGWSGADDMTSGGAQGNFFTVQTNLSSGVGAFGVVQHPRAFLRADWRKYDGDAYGNITGSGNGQGYYNKSKGRYDTTHTDGGEICWDGGTALEDVLCVVVATETDKEKLISMLEADGVGEINGVALVDFVLVGSKNLGERVHPSLRPGEEWGW